jgi:ribosomal-protein-alanine N-acetyltransferase
VGVAQAAAGLGAATLWLEVAATNAAALSLYHRQGFAATGRRRGYFRDAAGAVVDAVVMRRALAAAA